jgi:hypothetical protein
VNHYLVYHNAEKMGHSYRDDDGRVPDGYGIVTSKKPDSLIGSAVWVISGEGQPREYRLEYWFVVDDFDAITDPKFSAEVYGARGHRFSGGVPIGHMPWFAELRERMGNFGLGLQPLSAPEVAALSAAAEKAGGLAPT